MVAWSDVCGIGRTAIGLKLQTRNVFACVTISKMPYGKAVHSLGASGAPPTSTHEIELQFLLFSLAECVNDREAGEDG